MASKLAKYGWMIKAFLKAGPGNQVRSVKGFLGEKKYFVPASGETNTNMKELARCAICPNMCKFECPSLRVTKREMYSPAAKSRISYHVLRGDLDPADPHTAEVPYMCTNCDGCRHWCPMDISTGKLLKGVRADLVEAGHVPESLVAFNERVLENKTTFQKDTFSSNPAFDVSMENADVLYYPGCVMAEKKPGAVLANIKVLKAAGVAFCTMASKRQCCGGPPFTVGFRDTTRAQAEQNLALFSEAGVSTVVTDCPACADTIRQTYPDLGFEHDVQVFTTTEYYARLLKEGRIVPEQEVNIVVTYHDPCIAARGFGDVESARFVMSKIPGLELREAFLHGKETQCCGMGGVSHVHHPVESEAIGTQRYTQLEGTGAEKYVTSCPACCEGLMIAAGTEKERILDIGELLAMSLPG